MIQPDNRALFIGVNDYRAFDESQHNPPGTSDLRGSRNDAHAFWRVCQELGIPAANMRILTSPALDPSDLGASPEQVGEATRAAILEGIEWLAEALGGAGRPPGLLTYSGHGDFAAGEGLVLCPTDVTGNLEGAISFRGIQEILLRHRAAANLTVVLDCCHGGASVSTAERRSLSLTGRSLPEGAAAATPALGDRQLAAAEPSGTAWQARFSGVFRGAFSWALAAVLGQWKPRIEGSSVELALPYGDLLVRARSLLSALSFEQTPVLRGPSGVARVPFFHRGPLAGDEAASLAPTARRKGGQLDPGVNHTLTASVSSSEWLISATASGTAPTSTLGYTYDTEYWGLDSAFLDAVNRIASSSGGGSITFGVTSTADRPSSGFAMPTDSLWTRLAGTPAEAMFWAYVPATSSSAAYVTGVVFHLTAPARAGGAWGGSMTWYAGVPSGQAAPEYVIGKSPTTLSYGALPAQYSSPGYTWSAMTLPPLTWSSTPVAVPQSTSVRGDASLDVLVTSLAAWGSSMIASVADNTQGWISTFVCQAPGQPFQQGSGTNGGTFTALAAAYDALYLAYQSSGQLYVGRTTSPGVMGFGGSLTNIALPAGYSSGFALAGASSALYLAYLSAANAPAVAQAADESGTRWNSLPAISGATASGTPALAWFNGALYLAFTTADAAPSVKVFRLQGSAWVPSADLAPLLGACPRGIHAPALGVFNGRLFLACLDAGSNDVWLCSSADGATWSGYEDLTTRCPQITTQTNPALCAVGSSLYLAWAAPPGASQVWTLCSLTPA